MMKKMLLAATATLALAFAAPALAAGPQISVNGSVSVSSVATRALGGGTVGSLSNTIQMNSNSPTHVSLPGSFNGTLKENGAQMGSYSVSVAKGNKSDIGSVRNMVTLKDLSPTTLKLR